jgi:hypothetical protein
MAGEDDTTTTGDDANAAGTANERTGTDELMGAASDTLPNEGQLGADRNQEQMDVDEESDGGAAAQGAAEETSNTDDDVHASGTATEAASTDTLPKEGQLRAIQHQEQVDVDGKSGGGATAHSAADETSNTDDDVDASGTATKEPCTDKVKEGHVDAVQHKEQTNVDGANERGAATDAGHSLDHVNEDGAATDAGQQAPTDTGDDPDMAEKRQHNMDEEEAVPAVAGGKLPAAPTEAGGTVAAVEEEVTGELYEQGIGENQSTSAEPIVTEVTGTTTKQVKKSKRKSADTTRYVNEMGGSAAPEDDGESKKKKKKKGKVNGKDETSGKMKKSKAEDKSKSVKKKKSTGGTKAKKKSKVSKSKLRKPGYSWTQIDVKDVANAPTREVKKEDFLAPMVELSMYPGWILILAQRSTKNVISKKKQPEFINEALDMNANVPVASIIAELMNNGTGNKAELPNLPISCLDNDKMSITLYHQVSQFG